MNKVLIISESIFCDVEKDCQILSIYYDRLILNLRSINQLSIDGFDFVHFLYISKDKAEYILKIKNILAKNNKNVKIIEYEHPCNGYPWKENTHIDLIKNPNKSPGYRDQLFEKVSIDFAAYSYFVRIAIDDDDAWLNHHLVNVFKISQYLRNIFLDEDVVVGAAILSTYVAKVVDRQNITVDKVNLSRAICGNKFFCSSSWEKIKKWSPWALPDRIDEDSLKKFKKNFGISYFLIKNLEPGLVYFRRGQNLSAQNKDWCIDNYIDRFCFSSEDAVLEITKKNDSNEAEVLAEIEGLSVYHNFAEL